MSLVVKFFVKNQYVGKKISLGYKHLAPGSGKCGKKEWSLFGRFQRSLEKTFKLKIQSRGRPLILQKGSTTKNISVGGINVLLLVIGFAKKKGCHLSIFNGVE
jgi:hypothetical protein